VLLVLLCASIGAGSLRAQQTLPAGAGADVIRTRCVACHDTDVITSQRLSSAGWGREIDKMVRWGVLLLPEQREALQPYLAAHFGPVPAASHTSTSTSAENGEATLTRACFGCHGVDLIEQQRLSRPGWVREVEKMMRWGANVPATEKDPLVDHLAARYGVR
jgi:mono/diheme cytochrome c family protein